MAAGDAKTSRPVTHKDENRRDAILRTATKLFSERGFRETNLNQIALELNFRRQAVYHYFPAKEEILYELIAQAGAAMTESSQSLFDADLPPDVKLARIIANHVRVVLSRVDIFRVQFKELDKLTGPRAQALRDGMWSYVQRTARVIEAGQDAGIFVSAPPISQALLIIGMCNGTTEWYDGERTHLTVDQVADDAARLAISGLTAKSG
ncbi:TetR/AcrR family transcriptional regulator [Mycobacterium sp. 3519A]|uniref:TetR/AcrR family transcriptional regulator n=1 Tax=Mycobacterium sp. 3519A TaxID=2057184 RepID=UPI000C7B7F4B|nr:TetR/AcrR family transcriptional regulator [Mycobacterium sp. 3519A]